MRQPGRRAATSVFAGVLAGLIAAGPAHAGLRADFVPLSVAGQTKPKLVIVAVPVQPGAQETASRVEAVARRAVQKSGRFEVVNLVDLLDAENARGRESRAKEGRDAVDAARIAYNDLDTTRALVESDKAIKAFGDTDLTAHMKDLTSAWIFKIASIVANGENKAAQFEIERLLSIDPDASFSPNFFPPEEIAYAERIRRQLEQSKETMEVKTTPPGAEIYVNGTFAGISPVTVQDVPVADHYVTAKLTGYAFAQQKTKPGSVELTLRKAEAWPRYESLVTRVSKDPEGKMRDGAAREFGQWLGVEQVLLLVVDLPAGAKAPRLIALRLDPKDGHNYAFAQVPALPAGDAMAAQVETTTTSLLARDAVRKGGPITHFKDGAGGNTRKIAGYALIGAGAAIFVTGIALGVAANGQHQTFRGLQQTDPTAQTVTSTGRTYALVADLSFLTGLAAAGAGGYLAFFPGLKAGAAADQKADPKKADDRKQTEVKKTEEKKAEEKKTEEKKAEEKKKEAAKPVEKPKPPEEKKKRPVDDEDDLRNY